jgi:hypothetical protein
MINMMPVIVAATQKHIVEQFKSIGALSPEHGVPLEALQIDHEQYSLARGELSRMIKEGSIHQQKGKYWLDQAAHDAYKSHVTKQSITILALVFGILVLAIILIFALR